MPLDPSISTQLQFPSYGTGGAAGGLGMVGQFAQIQNQLNTAKLFQQTFGARQLMGQIFSSAPDTETAFQQIMQSPAAPFATETLNSYRQMENTLIDMQGKMQGQSQSALQSLLKSFPAAIADPSVLPGLVQANLATLPPGAKVAPQVRQAYGDVITALTNGLPADKDLAAAQFRNRLYGLSLAGGVSPDVLAGVVGKPFHEVAGGQLVGGLERPAIAGGGITVNSTMGLTAPPGFGPPGEVPRGGAYGTGIPPTTNAPSGLGMPPPADGTSIGPMSITPSGGASPATAPATSPGTGIWTDKDAGDGKPLFPADKSQLVSPHLGIGTGGGRILSKQQQETEAELSKEFNTSGQKAYNNAQISLGSLNEMNSDLDNVLRDGGGFLTPGAAAQARKSIATGINTAFQVFGGEPPFDPSKVSGLEDMVKLTKRMGISTLTQMLGNQREAALTIQSITQAVPSIENSPLGIRFISSMLQAQAQREVALHEWQRDWSSNNQGQLSRSEEMFNKFHPVNEYIDKALGDFGMSTKGFVSPEAVINAWHQGYMTKDQAANQIRTQWPQGHPDGATPSGAPTPAGTSGEIQ